MRGPCVTWSGRILMIGELYICVSLLLVGDGLL